MTKNILVTGGAGFIGSHTCVALIEAGFTPLVVDNLGNADAGSLERIAQVAACAEPIAFWRGDVRDGALLDDIFATHRVHAVVHFAGLKSVGESVAHPVSYYDCNVQGSLSLVAAMQRAGVHRLIFSSSATVYGQPESSPVCESAVLQPCSPYGRSKLFVERLLQDLAQADARWRIASLRYFNPAGAHPSGLLGERTAGAPNNLLPVLCKVASSASERLTVHGGDYPTPDGTCVRDYVHVMDVAEGHLAALRHLDAHAGASAFNLGVGRGTSVMELIGAFGRACGADVRHAVGPRRDGDAAAYWADVELMRKATGWSARRTIADICGDAWRWQQSQGVQQPAGVLAIA
ncbi:UDP-glucose 4-epimerase GalE [Variovorax sp. J22G73]|uniref:UDP-glucose 4-epimerase GalE n=1 Tax=unclassified Variovorax TaxID=663243 RepID=UPI0025766341|nr:MULTISPECIES: UDP-glucose 4-epimerase GalE [unclassified Variovorax]MDM0009514.1 UDP-glucose 4-epimerase GalE [Variovorax sp. J22R203]MDM0102022.1 UDP-glucose 4-epimerase GalE [Variovorax sp. J22G73]